MTRQLTFDGGAGAVVSGDGRYRYALTRTWRPDAPLLTFVMLNPSTADAYADDPTIRRCIGFARREGAAGIRVANLFAYRATSPAALVGPVDAAADDPRVGPLTRRPPAAAPRAVVPRRDGFRGAAPPAVRARRRPARAVARCPRY